MTRPVIAGPVAEAELPALRELAGACLAADGGLPQFASEDLLRARLLSGRAIAGRDETGRIVAAAGLVDTGFQTVSCGMVHPDRRGEGLGRLLLAWAVRESRGRPLTVVTETSSPGAERLYARFAMVEVFAERVLKHPLAPLPEVPAPQGITVVPAGEASPAERFAAYVGSFSDRPDFTAPPAEAWLAELDHDEQFRPDQSLVARVDGAAVGFVNLVGSWIDQVGVVPAWRRRGLGGHLVTRALAALAAHGADAGWLTVNIDNGAALLYERLGFVDAGRRARFAAPAP